MSSLTTKSLTVNLPRPAPEMPGYYGTCSAFINSDEIRDELRCVSATSQTFVAKSLVTPWQDASSARFHLVAPRVRVRAAIKQSGKPDRIFQKKGYFRWEPPRRQPLWRIAQVLWRVALVTTPPSYPSLLPRDNKSCPQF